MSELILASSIEDLDFFLSKLENEGRLNELNCIHYNFSQRYHPDNLIKFMKIHERYNLLFASVYDYSVVMNLVGIDIKFVVYYLEKVNKSILEDDHIHNILMMQLYTDYHLILLDDDEKKYRIVKDLLFLFEKFPQKHKIPKLTSKPYVFTNIDSMNLIPYKRINLFYKIMFENGLYIVILESYPEYIYTILLLITKLDLGYRIFSKKELFEKLKDYKNNLIVKMNSLQDSWLVPNLTTSSYIDKNIEKYF